jgi:hypothetical protein
LPEHPLKPLLFPVLASLVLLGMAAEPKKPDPKDLPKITVALPLGAAPGATTRLTLRGLKLDGATEVRCHAPMATVKLLKKGKAAVPNQQEVGRVGDTQVEIELTLPRDYPGRTVTVAAVAMAGEGPPHPLLVERESVLAEKEPNNGFAQAQTIRVPQEVQGSIGGAMDVDLFRFEGKAGQQLSIEVHAARLGSPLDPLLTLYDGDGHILASDDDGAGGSDARLDVTLPKDGAYFVGVIDANDQGGPVHVYRLSLRAR